jgi:hypothetical protein
MQMASNGLNGILAEVISALVTRLLPARLLCACAHAGSSEDGRLIGANRIK